MIHVIDTVWQCGYLSLAEIATTSDISTLAFLSGSQFFVALIAGVLMAFAFQFLLSNLTIAADVSSGANPFKGEAKSWGQKVRGMESKVGGWLLFIVNAAVFAACFLAVKLTLVQNMRLGAIIGIVIWSAYFLLLLWAGSRTVGAVFSTVGSTAATGLQGVVGTVATALSGSAVNAQIVNTVEASVEAVTRELKSELASDLAPDRVREQVSDYIQKLQLPSSNIGGATGQITNLLKQASPSAGDALNLSNVAQAASSGGLTAGLISLAQAAAPDELRAGKLQKVAQQLIQTLQSQNQSGQNQSGQDQSRNGLQQQVLTQGINALISTVAQRVDLSDIDVEHIGQQLTHLQQQATHKAEQAADGLNLSGNFSLLRTDVESYLLNSPTAYLDSERLDTNFREVLRDADADPGLVRSQLEPLNRRYFVSVLRRREGLDENRINDLADQMEVVRREVLSQVREAEEEDNRQDLRRRVETYLSSAPREDLNPDRISQDFPALLADPEASYETLGNRLLQFDRGTLKQMLLEGRQDVNEGDIEPILDALEQSRDRFLNQSQEQWQQMQNQASELRGQVEAYLREANPSNLSADQIQQNLERLANLPESGLLIARAGLGQIDRNSLETMLAQREDLSQEQVHEFIDRFEDARDRIVHMPQAITGQVQEQYDRLISQIADYLRNTNLEELNPDGIRHDLQMLLQSPKAGSSAIRRRLAQVDRDTLARLLSQQGISEYQVNQVIDIVLDVTRTVVRAPRRLASRTREQVQDVQSTLADYLKHTNREELNPEGIRRDLRFLFTKPQHGLEQWRDRMSQVDRGTLVALLSQREDISEEEANHILDQVDAVRHELLDKAQQATDQVQQATQSVLNNLMGRLQGYLNDLDQPELNYDGIKQDMRTLFNDPEAGAEALKYRLQQFDRDTLTAILSTRTDISEEQANRVIDQIESARDSVLHQAQRLQTETEKRINALQEEAKQQADEVRKSVATAAWWLFGTAITSAATAAIAGIIAVRGLEIFS